MEHIYIIEDERPIRRMVCRMLERGGYQVTPFECAADAFSAFQKLPAEIIITDHSLPDYSGAELTRKIKAIAPETTAVLMSGFSIESCEPELFDAHIEKPILDLDQILDTVMRVTPLQKAVS